MYVKGDPVFYYITVMNEQYEMPPMPEGVRDGILKGMYLFKRSAKKAPKVRAQLLGSGAILPEVIKAARTLEELKRFRDVIELPVPDSQIADAPFYHPGPNSEEV